MSLFRNKKQGKPPHTWYPEILRWREGDIIHCWNIAKAIGYVNVSNRDISIYLSDYSTSTGYASAKFKFKSVNESGMIYLEDKNDHLVEFEFWRFIKCSMNESLKSRKIEDREESSQQYMELMKNFQKAFDELQEADNHPKRLGEKNENS